MRLRNNSTPTLLARYSRRTISYLAKFGAVLVIIGLLATSVLPGKLQAQGGGGVGSGGSGSGSGVAGACTSGNPGHWTRCGWGWAVYATGGPGPTSGFRDSTRWSDVQATCRSAGASSVYGNIIYDAALNGRIYDYKSAQDGPPQYRSHFVAGTSVDHGRARAIDTSEARSAYDSLSPALRAGFTFGNDVGWFCYNFAPPASPNGYCDIESAPASVSPGASFTATIRAYNNGNTTWSVDSAVADRFQIGSASPQNNGTWGTGRVDIEGRASGFGRVVDPDGNSLTRPNPATFTAPTTPGTYTFAWQILREGVSWYGPVCSRNITVSAPSGIIQGRIWNDVNSNGAYDGGEQLIQNPAGVCGGYMNQPASVTVSGYGPSNPSFCNPQPHYRRAASTGSHTVSVNPPPGWVATTGTQTVNVVNGGVYDVWFGVRLSSGCPSLDPSTVNVFLPDQSPNTGPPSGDASSPNQEHHEYNPQSRTATTATDDISGTDTGAKVGSPSYRLPITSQSYQQAGVEYKPFIDNYPYDYNQANVSYDSYYDDVLWRSSSSPTRYECNPGDSRSGSTCTTYWTHWHSSCHRHSAFVPCHRHWTAHTHSSTYPATPYYAWSRVSTTERRVNNTVNGPTMSPCFDRDFNVTPRAVSAVWSPSSEDPNQVRFFSQIDYSFSTTADGGVGVRRSLKVRTNVVGDYYIKRGASIIRPIPSSGRCGGAYSSGSTSVLIDSYNYGRSASGTFDNTDCFNVSVPPLQMGDIPCFTISTNPSQGGMYPDGSVRSVSTGNRTSAEFCNTSNPVQNLPYMRIYSNDVFAGGGLIGSTCRNSAGIYAYQNGTGRGSTTQLAAYALSQIDQFGSAQIKNPDFGLTFGNQAGYGYFDSTQCIPDYYGTKPDVTTDPGNSININPLGTGGYQHTGDVNVTGGNVNPNQRTALYIDGNVSITGDIRFPANYRLNNAPTLFIIVRGNIYIDPAVTRLDGIFIAQGGTIYTCASHAPPFSDSELFANCTSNKQLVINGGLIGQSIKFQRAFSSLRHSTSTETPIGPNHPCDVVASAFTSPLPVCGAEVINFDPLFYLSLPPFRTDSNRRYDAITSLPPVL